MGTPKLTPEMCQAAVDALAKHGNQVAAARAMGLSRSALQHRLAEAANPPRDPEVVVEPLTSRERFDAAFWRKKAVEAQRAANEAEHVADLVTIWRCKRGVSMMSVVTGGKVHDFELTRRRLSFILQEAARELTRDE